MISILSGLLFFIIANPIVFKLLRRLVGNWVASPTGCPTSSGLILHTFVFILLTWGMMNINKEYAEGVVNETAKKEVVEVESSEPAMEPAMKPAMKKPATDPVPMGMDVEDEDEDEMNSMMMQPMGVDVQDEDEMASVEMMKMTTGSEPFAKTYNSCSCDDGKKVLIMN